MSWQVAELCFAADHPTAAGHFPGNPLIPGAVILDEIIQAVAGSDCDQPMLVRAAKFLHIVRPGEKLHLRWQASPEGEVKFEARVAEVLAVTGNIRITGA